MTWRRPGPPCIPPNQAPDGVVVHIYTVPDEVLLIEQHMTPGDDIDALATAAGEATGRAQEAVCLVAYDGDTGVRISHEEWMAAIQKGTNP